MELDKDYYDMACKRIDKMKSQMDMFNDFKSEGEEK